MSARSVGTMPTVSHWPYFLPLSTRARTSHLFAYVQLVFQATVYGRLDCTVRTGLVTFVYGFGALKLKP